MLGLGLNVPIMLSNQQVEVVRSYIHLWVTFNGRLDRFSMTQATKDRLTRGYMSLSLLERMPPNILSRALNKGVDLWLISDFCLIYVVVILALGLPPLMWSQLERPLVMTLSRQIRSKSTMPHEIIREDFTAPNMLVESPIQLVVFINRIHSQPQHRISRQAFDASRSLYDSRDTSSWCSTMINWLLKKGIDINNLSSLRYDQEIDKMGIVKKWYAKKYDKFIFDIDG